MRALTRTMSFFSKWMAEVVRQPALMVSLVLGPFLILLAFGTGVDIGGPRPKTLLVRAPNSDEAIQPLPDQLNDHIDLIGETDNLDYARGQLKDGKVDAVAVLPPKPIDTIKDGKHIPIHILISEIDPVTKSYTRAYLGDQVAELNQQTIAKAIADAQSSIADIQKAIDQARPIVAALNAAGGDIDRTRQQVSDLKALLGPLSEDASRASDALSGASFVVPGLGNVSQQADRLNQLVSGLNDDVNSIDQRLNGSSGTVPTAAEIQAMQQNLDEISATLTNVQSIPPDVLSAPFQLELENVAPFVPTFAGFYAPAVLVLLLQHLAITLGALSMSRVRLLGVMDILRVSPVRAIEVVFGNYLAYGAICVIAGAALFAVTTIALDVPIFGSYWLVALGVLLLVVAGLGVGFVVSLVSSSEQQAAQISMLILLAAIFFSGFVFSLDRVEWPIRAISYALPSTYAIRNLQDVMLRGVLREPSDLAVLALVMTVFFAGTYLLFRREFRPS